MIDYHVLKSLSKTLNDKRVTWGIGGSFLLMLNGLYPNPQDLDLWVKPSDMPLVRELFSDYQELSTNIPLPKELHYKILYHNVEIDFIACFIIRPNQNRYVYQIMPENIRMNKIGDVEVPCTMLEEWFVIYRLLKKDDKAKIIQDYFRKKSINFDEDAIIKAIQNSGVSLPPRILKDVHKLIKEVEEGNQLFWNLPESMELTSMSKTLEIKGRTPCTDLAGSDANISDTNQQLSFMKK